MGVLGGKQNELLFTKEVSRQFLRPTLSPLLAAAGANLSPLLNLNLTFLAEDVRAFSF